MRLKIMLGFAAIFSLLPAKGFAQNSNDISGTYWSPKKDGKIEIFTENEQYHGKFVWTKQPKKDHNNPDAALRNRDLLGLIFLQNFTLQDDKYIDGTIYDPDSGKTYNCLMWSENGDLKVRGYLGFSLFGRTETFRKVK